MDHVALRAPRENPVTIVTEALPTIAAVMLAPTLVLLTAPLGVWFAWRDDRPAALRLTIGLTLLALAYVAWS